MTWSHRQASNGQQSPEKDLSPISTHSFPYARPRDQLLKHYSVKPLTSPGLGLLI